MRLPLTVALLLALCVARCGVLVPAHARHKWFVCCTELGCYGGPAEAEEAGLHAGEDLFVPGWFPVEDFVPGGGAHVAEGGETLRVDRKKERRKGLAEGGLG